MVTINNFSLILGCGGCVKNNISLCSGTTSTIIDFSKYIKRQTLDDVVNFLDNTCGLFDSMVGEWNKLVNIIKILHDKYALIDDKAWLTLHTWFIQHKPCGAYLRLVFNHDMQEDPAQQEQAIIPENKINK